MRSRGRSLFLITAFAYVCFFTGEHITARYLALRVGGQLLPVLLLGLWLANLIRNNRPFPRTPLDLPLLTWFCISVAASLAGLCPRVSFERMWMGGTYALGLYALVDLQSRGWGPCVFRALFLVAGVVCLVGLFEWISWYLGLPFLPGRTTGWPQIGAGWIPPTWHRLNATLGGSTPLAAFLAVLIPPGLGWLLSTPRAETRVGLKLWLVPALLVEVLTFSRGGALALGVSLPLLAAAWVILRARRDGSGGRALVSRITWIGGAGVTALLVIAVAVGTVWLSRSFCGRQGSTMHRLVLWQVALDRFRAHPVLGVGPANFGRSLLLQNDPALPRRQIQTAHNAYLNTMAETGAAGLLAGAWLLWAGARAWMKKLKRASSAQRLRLVACAAALVGLAAQLLVDTYTAPANWLPILVLGAYVLRPSERRRHTDGYNGSQWMSVATLSALLLSAAWLGWKDVAQFHFERGMRLMRLGDFERAAHEVELARSTDPGLSLYTFGVAHVKAVCAGVKGERSLANQSIGCYREGLSHDPVWGKQSANLAVVLWREGRKAEAIDLMRQTVSFDPDPTYLLNLGLFYEGTGAMSHARRYYAKALARRPAWAGSDFWSADAGRVDAWDDLMRQAEEIVAETTGPDAVPSFRSQVALARGRFDELESLARPMIETNDGAAQGYIWLSRALLEQDRADEALLAAEQAVQISPQDSRALALRGCSRWQAEQDPRAIVDLESAVFISPHSRDAHACLGQIYEEQSDLEAATLHYGLALGPLVVEQDTEMTLYGRLATFEPLPEFVDVGLGDYVAAPWLDLARLYEELERCEQARTIYKALLARDQFLEIARERLRALPCCTTASGGGTGLAAAEGTWHG